jgi:hypothetical protein
MTDINNNIIDNNIDVSIESIDTEEVATKKIEERKCAPGIKFEAGSCITLPVLVEMINAYNKVNTNKIKLNDRAQLMHPPKYKKYLLKKIKDRYENVCDGQLCWMQQDFIKHMNEFMRIELEKYTLRPLGPEGRFEWLNTININEVMEQYQKIYKDYKFLGAVPIDFQEINLEGVADLDLDDCYNRGIKKIGIVFNLDASWQSGSHWVAAYGDIKKGYIYFYDSYGTSPVENIVKFMKKFDDFYKKKFNKKIDMKHNTTRHQYENSECGVYSINFILQLLNGKSMSYITDVKIKDKVINKLRKKIFRNVNFKTRSDSPDRLVEEKNLLNELI